MQLIVDLYSFGVGVSFCVVLLIIYSIVKGLGYSAGWNAANGFSNPPTRAEVSRRVGSNPAPPDVSQRPEPPPRPPNGRRLGGIA